MSGMTRAAEIDRDPTDLGLNPADAEYTPPPRPSGPRRCPNGALVAADGACCPDWPHPTPGDTPEDA